MSYPSAFAFAALWAAAAAVGDAGCNSAVENTSIELILGSVCNATGSACPAGCSQMFTDTIAACEGKSYDDRGNETAFDKATWSAGMAIFLDDGPCKGAAVEAALFWGVSCSESLTLYASAVVFFCQDEGEDTKPCPGICKSIMDQAFSECRSTDTTMSNGGTEVTAASVKMAGDFLMTKKCKDYAATKVWKVNRNGEDDGGDEGDKEDGTGEEGTGNEEDDGGDEGDDREDSKGGRGDSEQDEKNFSASVSGAESVAAASSAFASLALLALC